VRENCTSRVIERTEAGPHRSTSADSTLRGWESPLQGEGPQLLGSLVVTLLDGKAWESWLMPAEREMGCKSNRRGPCAVQVACTVPTGRWRDGSYDTALCPYPLSGAVNSGRTMPTSDDAVVRDQGTNGTWMRSF
jgi:hypothetical protein